MPERRAFKSGQCTADTVPVKDKAAIQGLTDLARVLLSPFRKRLDPVLPLEQRLVVAVRSDPERRQRSYTCDDDLPVPFIEKTKRAQTSWTGVDEKKLNAPRLLEVDRASMVQGKYSYRSA